MHCDGIKFHKCKVPGLASFPGFPTVNMHSGEPGIFSREHDKIEIGPKFLQQKGNILCVVLSTTCSTIGVYDIPPR